MGETDIPTREYLYEFGVKAQKPLSQTGLLGMETPGKANLFTESEPVWKQSHVSKY